MILELPYLHNLTSFWHRFCFDLVRLCMIMSTQKRKTKATADIGHQGSQNLYFHTPPLTEKIIRKFSLSTFLCWSILINAEMLIMTKIKFKFVRFCWLSKFWTNNEFSGWLHARSCSMVCDATERDRLMPLEVKAIHKACTHRVWPDSSLSDV